MPKSTPAQLRAQRNSVKRRMLFLRTYKESEGCRLCGNHDIRVLEFHHFAPDKPSGRGVDWHNISWAKLEAELEKCWILCANCHRIVEHEELGS